MTSHLTKQLVAPNGVSYVQPLGLFINNEWVTGKEKEIEVIYPGDESTICHVQSASVADANAAVQAARYALNSTWKGMAAIDRAAMLLKLADLLDQNAEILATIESWDNGKTFQSSLEEDIPACSGALRYNASLVDKFQGHVIEPDTSKFAYTIREPIGVCALIVAWNYPLVNLVWKMAPAIAAGNTVIIKPAQQTPLSALYFANLVKEAGIPAGVVNILNGAGRLTGSCLVEHPGVNMVSFTGSTPVAMDIMARAAKTLKPVTLEAGGKSPLIVFDDADLVQAARWAHAGIMSNQGQICSATSRLVVHHSVFDEFVAELKQTIKSRSRIGNPFLAETFQGPQVTRNQYNQILSYIKSGKEEGATLVMGGNVYHEPSGKGLYIEPTIFTDVLPSMTIFQEEIFGPVVVVTKFSTEAEAIELANDTQYGLAAAVFTTNNSRAHAVARQIEAGTVWINSSNDADYRIPFGGKGLSGIGRESGEQGFLEFTSTKAIHVNLSARL